ncbi:pyridoxamine 5'-phosphate oxidase family protein [Collinsella bouchesdurhonensis]|uniref:pyridoxamine 5'-phosphate oxidase family protein n=1 Tax=Collinsella bouchesdurhonensis TaxID=1907654 RepID=UPI002A78FA95|nr:pyridoxamine 5'-phosphate oxidase family protein [Collinsella bouchesdurhonensis]
MDEIVSYLRRIPAWYLATIDVNDPTQPRVRPFSFAMADAGKLWFCTSRDKDVWFELETHPKFELSGWKPGECWIVLSGTANLADDAQVSDAVREAGFKHMVGIGEHHSSANDGRLAFFSVEAGTARFCDIDGSERVVKLDDLA